MGYRVYEYGLLAPTESREAVLEQLWLGHRYQNALVAIERSRREAVLAAEGADPTVTHLRALHAALEEVLLAELAAVKQANILARKRKDRRADVAESRAAIKVCDALLRVASVLARQQAKDSIATINEQAAEARRSARATSGLFSATYQIMEQAADAAAKAALKLSSAAEPIMPHFQHWTGEGRIAVGGTSTTPGNPRDPGNLHIRIEPSTAPPTADVPDEVRLRQPPARWGKTRYRTEAERTAAWLARPAEDRLWDRRPRAEAEPPVTASRYATLHFRARSDPKTHGPVWATFPIIVHRPLAEKMTVKWGTILRRLVADRERWLLQLTVVEDDPISAVISGAVGVDLGWRQHPQAEMRAGYAVDDAGHEQEILVPARTVAGLRKADEIESIRDKLLDRAKAVLGAGIATSAVPSWVITHCAHLDKWRSQGRMAALVKEWRRGPDRDHVLASWLLEWLHQDRHLWQWAAEQRTRALRHRREHYRKIAAEMAERYGTLVIEGGFDLRKFAVEPPPEEPEGPKERKHRKQRVDTAPSELRSCLVGGFRSRGRRVIEEPCAYTTMACAERCADGTICGHINVFSKPDELMQSCVKCDKTWDQDSNAGKNLVRAAKRGNGSPSPLAAKKPGRTARLREAGRRKRAEIPVLGQTARNEAAKDARL